MAENFTSVHITSTIPVFIFSMMQEFIISVELFLLLTTGTKDYTYKNSIQSMVRK